MEEINLTELLQYYLKKIPIIIIITIFAVIAGFVYTMVIQEPLYHGTTTIILVQGGENSSENASQYYNEVTLNQKLVSTYSQIIKSRRVLDQVIKELDLKTSTSKLASNITVSAVNDTSIIKITVSDVNNEQAAIIANEIAYIFKKEVSQIYNLENISIIDKAIVEERPYNIHIKRQLAIAGLIGFVLSCGIIFVLYYFDNTIKNKKEIETKLNLPVLGEIPTVTKLLNKTVEGED